MAAGGALRLPQEDQKMLQFYSSYRGEDWQATYARITGMNRNTLRSRFARALRKLREESRELDTGGVHAWIEDVGEAFWVGDRYRLPGSTSPRSSAISRPRRWPACGRRQSIVLLVVVAGEDVEADPPSRSLLTGEAGSREPLAFDVLLIRGGRPVVFVVSVFTQPELELVREVAVLLPEVKYRIPPPEVEPASSPDRGRG